LDRLADRFRACGLRRGLTAEQATNEQAANGAADNDAHTRHSILRYYKLNLILHTGMT
jgi:hypothetical protein